ncbi:MAG: glycerol-3-phosphate 1-O-acyltransferase PlsY [Prevotellaceae bacterium]|nr:glycerol-3-phosphate 1-O-acyltransferase PlsY [Prevotellaceae bacterium]
MNILYILYAVAAYLIGSVSSAVLIAKTRGIDIREHGSGNAGATNVLRVLGAKAAIMVFIADFCKGLIAVLFVRFTPLNQVDNPELYAGYEIILGICAVLGHIFPIFASFRGGKGVATTAGILVAISPFPMLVTLCVFIITLSITHYVSLGSIMSAISYPLVVIFLFGIILQPSTITNTLKIFSICASSMIIFTHRKNIKRLRKGVENKISFKNKRKSEF